MQMALDQARLAPALGEVPIAAVIVMDGQLLSQVHNFREVWQDPTAHAEVVAIREAATRLKTWRLTGTTMYVTIEPCVMCAGASYWTQISRIVYGASDPQRGFSQIKQRILHPRTEVISGIRATECGQLVKDFFQKKRNKI